MDRDKVKFLIQSIEVLIDELKSVVYTNSETHKISETSYSYNEDVDSLSTDEIIRRSHPVIQE